MGITKMGIALQKLCITVACHFSLNWNKPNMEKVFILFITCAKRADNAVLNPSLRTLYGKSYDQSRGFGPLADPPVCQDGKYQITIILTVYDIIVEKYFIWLRVIEMRHTIIYI
jgi:hypothetical protein